ncbi:hypothetical protein [Arthrobacter pigmenti]
MTIDDTHGDDAAEHCWLCSLPAAALEYHVMDATVLDRVECANTNDSNVGVELCAMCHQAVHRWMQANAHKADHPAADAVVAIFSRFTHALLGTEHTKKGRGRNE